MSFQMKIRLLLFSGLLQVFLFSNVDAKTVDRIVAIVGKEPITMSGLNQFYERLKQAPPELTQKGQILQDRRKVLDLLIEQKIFQNEVKRLGMEATDKEVKSEIESIKSRLNLSDKDLRDMLKERGTTYDIYKDYLKQQIEQRRLISQEIRSNVSVSKEDIINYYQQNIAKAAQSLELHARHIFLQAPPSGELEVRKKAEQIVKAARSGEAFSTLASKYSEGPESGSGGDLGWFSIDQVIPEFQNAIKKLRPGQISDPFRTAQGIHILQLIDIRQPTPPALDERTKERIQNIIYQERIGILLNQWIEGKKRPEDGYYIEILL